MVDMRLNKLLKLIYQYLFPTASVSQVELGTLQELDPEHQCLNVYYSIYIQGHTRS